MVVSGKWENWPNDWVLVNLPLEPHLDLAIEPPPRELLSECEWKPPIAPEFGLVLHRIKGLAQAGVTFLMVAFDFLNR
jgi:hypothetical protein